MSTFLWVIFIFIGFYYGFKLFLRYILPWLLARFIRKQQEKFTNMNQGSPSQDEIRVNTNKKKSSKKDDGSFGEYVDFEEIDDKP
ncbi:MAG TPA: hypothetical protein VIN10_03450 [Bacteroidales bacterium]